MTYLFEAFGDTRCFESEAVNIKLGDSAKRIFNLILVCFHREPQNNEVNQEHIFFF